MYEEKTPYLYKRGSKRFSGGPFDLVRSCYLATLRVEGSKCEARLALKLLQALLLASGS